MEGSLRDESMSDEATTPQFQENPVHEAMAFVSDCDAYMEAVGRCPGVVQSDSPHELFLAYCDYNVWDAAGRLASYWKYRLQLFGPTDAFKPLPEAVGEDDKRFLLQGVGTIMDKPDALGRSVFVIDRTRRPDVLPPLAVRFRATFFAMQALALHASRLQEQSTTPFSTGEVVLVVRSCKHMAGSGGSKEWFKFARELLNSAICLRFVEFHFVTIYGGSVQRIFDTIFQKVVPIAVQTMLGVFGGPRLHIHAGQKAEVAASLEQHRIPQSCLPTDFGGAWSFERDWSRWLRQEGIALADSTHRRPGDSSKGQVERVPSLDSPIRSTIFYGDPVHEAMPYVEGNDEYLDAVDKCPNVVASESPHRRYHQWSGMNAIAAATRLAKYWRLRVQAFGPSAFMPLSDALTKEDKNFIRRGALVPILPVNGSHPVLIVDRSRRENDVDFSAVRCSFWFVFQMLCEMAESCGSNDVILLNCISSQMKGSDTSQILELVESFLSANDGVMCIRFSELHLIVVPEQNRFIFQQLLDRVLPVVMQRAIHLFAGIKPFVHTGSRREILASLLSRGLSMDSIPAEFGGRLSYEKDWPLWLQSLGMLPLTRRDFLPCAESSLSGSLVQSFGTVGGDTFQALCGGSVHRAMMSGNVKDTAAYVAAVKNCPRVVLTESPLHSFLAFTVNDPLAAAQRLANYWRLRVLLFGNMAFLSLVDLLTSEDWEGISGGHRLVLPAHNDCTDSVLLVDQTRKCKPLSAHCALRSVWLQLHMAAAGSKSSDGAVVAICVFPKSVVEALPHHNHQQADDHVNKLFDEAMCIRVKELHVVIIDETSSAFACIAGPSSVPIRYVENQLRVRLSGVPATTHKGSFSEVSASLHSRGFEASCLPPVCGGTFPIETRWPRLVSDYFCALQLEPKTESAVTAELEKMLEELPREAPELRAEASGANEVLDIEQCTRSDRSEKSLHAVPRLLVPGSGNTVTAFRDNLVHEAMAFVEEKEAYLTAVQLCPLVVQAESPHELFLLHSESNMWEAARRLAAYWTLRKDIFGPDAAFLPMNDALSEDDWNYMIRAYQVTLPTDKMGRKVVYLDRQLFDRSASGSARLNARLRATFALLSVLSCTPAEIVVLVRLNNLRLSVMRGDKEVGELARRAFAEAMCAKLSCVHYISVLEARSDIPFVPSAPPSLRTLVSKLGSSVAKWFDGIGVVNHAGFKEAVVESLQRHGFEAEHLPRQCGGSWNIETNWPRDLERLMHRSAGGDGRRNRLSASREGVADVETMALREHKIATTTEPDGARRGLPTDIGVFARGDPGNGAGRAGHCRTVDQSYLVRAEPTSCSKTFDVNDPAMPADQLRSADAAVRECAGRHSLDQPLLIPREATKRRGSPDSVATMEPSANRRCGSITACPDYPVAQEVLRDWNQSSSTVEATRSRKSLAPLTSNNLSKNQHLTGCSDEDVDISRKVNYIMEARRVRRRKRNRNYSARLRAKSKASVDALKQRSEQLQDEHQLLLNENIRLEELLRQAKEMVSPLPWHPRDHRALAEN